MILLWGLEDDSPLRLVRDALTRIGAPFLFLDHADILEVELDLEFGDTLTGRIATRGGACRVEDLEAMYLRPYDFREFPHLAGFGADSPEWRRAADADELLWSVAEVTDGLVLNRPEAMQSNCSKPYQCRLIERQGFAVPETLITTDASVAQRFWAAHERVIYKSTSGHRSIVSCVDDGHHGRLEDLQWCPTQFQRHVAGVDHRVHVVGDRVFVTRVDSEDVDYRYGASRVQACAIPQDVSARCRDLARALDLPLAGIDLRRTDDGSWFCFEVNPSPAYSCYEMETGQPISQAIADLLARPRSRS